MATALIIVQLMAGPKQGALTVRPPAVAGRFYPAEAQACRAQAESYVNSAQAAESNAESGRNWIGGIVPHAGWICSGAIAGRTIAALATAAQRQQGRPIDVVVVFGAVHSAAPLDVAALDSHARWDVPGGPSDLPEALERRLIESSADWFRVDERFHETEHAIEVELPLIQVPWPNAMILPVEVPAIEDAAEIGIATAAAIEEAKLSAVFLASSDLTHYGPGYRFTPAGIGLAGLDWAKSNDRRMLELLTEMAVDRIVPEAQNRLNACGSGAIAAMLAACRERGATGGEILRHANSFETLAEVAPHGPENAVGYASVVIG
jgi:AmmeMemoRadiSam system protein B